jgi:uncharacterized protein
MTETETQPLSARDIFTFDCSQDVPCFNACCRDLNQFLTPYDILRLKTGLAMTSGAFLAQYTQIHTGPETGLPVVVLKPDTGRNLQCPFVTTKGCRVYMDRPASCRTYPLMRAVSRSRETGALTEHFMLLKEPHCRGFETGTPRTPRQWMIDQGVDEYNRFNDMLLDIISLKNRRLPGPLDLKSARLFQLALYDLDAFRIHFFDKGAHRGLTADPATLAAARTTDTDLLVLALEWARRQLFGPDPT